MCNRSGNADNLLIVEMLADQHHYLTASDTMHCFVGIIYG